MQEEDSTVAIRIAGLVGGVIGAVLTLIALIIFLHFAGA